jgi:GNAT superfamily N-acetyltransferase
MIYKCLYIETPDAAYLTLDAKYRAGFLDSETVWRHAREPGNDLDEASVRRALAAGDECFAIREGDRIAAYGWYSRAAIFHVSDTLRLHFDPRWVYMYRGFTHPDYRGQRLHAIGMTLALAAYRDRGARGFVSVVESWNEPSLKSCYRMGYHDFGTIYEIRLGRLFGIADPKSALLRRHLVFRTPGCEAFGFRLEALRPRRGWPDPLSSASAAFGKPSRSR